MQMPNIGNVKDFFKLQSEAKKMQDQMKQLVIEGVSKDEGVSLTMDGTQEILEVELSDDLLNPLMKDSLVKQIKEASKDAQKKLQKEMMKDFDMDKLKGMMGQ
ncbi:MAG: YbaB/EbfC family nucleoid-associated protein [bacterium]